MKNKLRKYREQRKLTQRELAQLVGVTDSLISHLEAGRKRGNIELWLKIAKVLKVPVEKLIKL